MTDRSRTVRIAGIDMGSNTVRLHIADVARGSDGGLTLATVERRTTITRLAQGVDARRTLLPESLARTRNALTDYRSAIRDHGAVFALVCATSAVRDADNGEAFLGEIEYGYGFRTLLLSGEEEAALGFRGVTSDDELWQRTRTGVAVVVDIGGGSTEIVIARDGALADHASLQLGSVRMTERFLSRSDPPAADDVLRAVQHVGDELATCFPDPPAVDVAIGVAGTVTTLAAFEQGLDHYDSARTHLATITSQRVSSELVRLSRMSSESRADLPCLEPKRAPVIVGGVLILECLLRHFSLATIFASERDILDGIALRAAEIALEEDIRELPEPFGRTGC